MYGTGGSPRQLGIAEPKCPSCLLWDKCSGSDTAPCDCIKPSGQKYNCLDCHIVCKDRYISSGPGPDTFSEYVRCTRDLDEVYIEQKKLTGKFPILIPMQTRELPENTKLACVGVSIYDLISEHKSPPVKPKKCLTSALDAKHQFRVSKSGRTIAIINGIDEKLENVWASNRNSFYNALKTAGILTATGPTFSINEKLPDGEIVPASHKMIMLRRHNQFIQELFDTGISPIPNIYWRDERDRNRWSDWLRANHSIHCVSRDFSATKAVKESLQALECLIDTLQKVGRKIHVIVIGVGHSKAASFIHKLASAGLTCSIATSEPVIKGWKGEGFFIRDSEIASEKDREFLHSEQQFSI